MKVIAIKAGYYNNILRNEGDVFEIDDKFFSEKWHKKISDENYSKNQNEINNDEMNIRPRPFVKKTQW